MHKKFLKAGALLGALAVVLGAFGAHGLKKIVGENQSDIFNAFQTGVQYQMYHALGLLVIGVLVEKFSSSLFRWAGISFLFGVLLFSGSLYAITFFKAKAINVPAFIGPITPVGGLFFIVGWLLLFFAITKERK